MLRIMKFIRYANVFSALCWILLIVISLPLHAAVGELDPSFGGDGKVTTPLGVGTGAINDVEIQRDGKIVVVGSIGIARLLATGGLDSTFGENGTGFPVRIGFKSVVIQPDGKSIAAGAAATANGSDFGLVRYTIDGSLDTSFDSDGIVLTDLDLRDEVNALLLQPDGKLVAGGTASTGDAGDFALARYNSDGSLDTSFDGDGKARTDFGNPGGGLNALLLQPDGKLVALGSALAVNGFDFVLVRYNADGSLDPSFGGDGIVFTDLGGVDEGAYALILQPDGKLVAAGFTSTSRNYDLALVRYNADGSLDTSFDSDGKVINNLSFQDIFSAMALQPDGKLVVGGRVDQSFALLRYHSDGSLDNSFDTDGKVLLDFGARKASALLLQPDGKLIVGGDGPMLTRFNNDGALDSTFATDGRYDFQVSGRSTIQDIVIQPDGKLVAAGGATVGDNNHIALVRYHHDGSLDSSFGSEGKVLTAFDTSSWTSALVLQPDGRLVVAGVSSEEFALVRYNSDGSLDNTFEGDGKVLTDLGGIDEANALVFQADGKLVAAGTTSAGGYDFALVRYNSDGSLDNGFAGDGKALTDFGGVDRAYDLVLQPDGKLVAAGYSTIGNASDVAIVRYKSDGTLDSSFDGDGKVLTDLGVDDNAFALVLQPDGKLVVAGYSDTASGYAITLVRYNSDGSLDSDFDGDGRVITNFGVPGVNAFALILQPDGKLIAAGSTVTDSETDFALVRYNANGSLDRSFGSEGLLLTNVSGRDTAFALLLQPDGKWVVGGQADNDFALVRYLGDAIPNPPTNTPTHTPTNTPTVCPQATPQPLWVAPVTSPTEAMQQTITVYIGDGEAVTVSSESGVYAMTGHYNSSNNPAQITIPLLTNTTHHLTVNARVKQGQTHGCSYGGYTLSTQIDRNGRPIEIVQQSATATPVPPTPTPTATPNANEFATITIVKQAQPQDPQDFQFHGPFGSFKLDDPASDDGDTLPKSITYQVRPGVYNFSEVVPGPWYLSDIVCNGGFSKPDVYGRTVNIRPKPSETIICTFTNQLRGRITAIKYNDLNGNRAMDAGEPLLANWGIRLYGQQFPSPLYSTTDGTGSVTYINLQPNRYKVCEIQQTGWHNSQPAKLDPVTKQPCYSLTTLPGQKITLYFGNTRGTLPRSSEDMEAAGGISIQPLSPDEIVPSNAIDTSIYEVENRYNLFLPVVVK